MKKLFNEVSRIVPQALAGFVRLHPGLALLEDTTTVVRADSEAFRRSDRVALNTGGGAGHEPAHAGYVGAAADAGGSLAQVKARALAAIDALASMGVERIRIEH